MIRMTLIVDSRSLLHDLLLLGWVAPLHHFLEQLQGCPRHQCQQNYLQQERPIDVADLEVCAEESDASDVDQERENDRYDHFPFDFGNFAQHIEHLDVDQCRESDAHDVHKRLVELRDRNEHNQARLVDRFPRPNEERLQI